VFRVYGYMLFVASPFVIGLVTSYLANRNVELSLGRTTSIVFAGMLLGGLAILGVAIEGAICLLMAAPLVGAMSFVGGLLGRAFALGRKQSHTTLMSVALLPFLIAGEALLPPRAGFESVESVDVAASPAEVWDAVVHMGPIPSQPAAPFRWGLAYPVRGEIVGTGVGSIRRGVFSTGVAYERVTEWEPQRKLSFIVLSDPPMLNEISPYQHVYAAHVVGYFKTKDARFEITTLADGRTRLTLSTRHELDLEPALYWMPITKWAIHENKMRVLHHFARQAETTRLTALSR
jgi:hypothetical protein